MPLSREAIAKFHPPEPVELGDYNRLNDVTAEAEVEYPAFPGGPKWCHAEEAYSDLVERADKILKANAVGIIQLSPADVALVEQGKESLLKDDEGEIEVKLRELRPAYAALLSTMDKALQSRSSRAKGFDIERIRLISTRLFDVINRTRVVNGALLSGDEEWDIRYVRERFGDLMARFFMGFCAEDQSNNDPPFENYGYTTMVSPELVFSLPDRFVLIHHLLLDRYLHENPTSVTHMFTGYPYGSLAPAFMIFDDSGVKGIVSDVFKKNRNLSPILGNLPALGALEERRGKRKRGAPPERDPRFWRNPDDSIQITLHGEEFGAKLPDFQRLKEWDER